MEAEIIWFSEIEALENKNCSLCRLPIFKPDDERKPGENISYAEVHDPNTEKLARFHYECLEKVQMIVKRI